MEERGQTNVEESSSAFQDSPMVSLTLILKDQMKWPSGKVDDMDGNPCEILPIIISKTSEQKITNFQCAGLIKWAISNFQTSAGHQVHKTDL